MERIFTPYASADDHRRVRTELSEADMAKVDRGYAWGPHRFTDQLTGTVFWAQGASCGQPRCFCAAAIVEIETPGSAPLAVFE